MFKFFSWVVDMVVFAVSWFVLRSIVFSVIVVMVILVVFFLILRKEVGNIKLD